MTRPVIAPRGYHCCPAGCGALVANRLFACLPDWRRLPEPLRRGITGAKSRDPRAHREAMAAAVRWYREQDSANRTEESR